MKFISFASGSSGNCGLIREGRTNLLYDAGISMKRIKSSLSELGLELKDITGIVISHEHSDHVSGLAMLSKYTDIPVYTSGGTARALVRAQKCEQKNLHIIESDKTVLIDDLEFTAFETPHDAAESFGYTFTCNRGSLAIATDLGCITRSVERAILGCKAAVIEANHDVDMLKNGLYPRALKMRILGSRGHLSNETCGNLAVRLAESGTKSMLLAHLSHENNTPDLAFEAVFKRLGEDIGLEIAPRDGFSVSLEI
jgi:phosphoribosyl 1,2-cyclic phosphodiesterase